MANETIQILIVVVGVTVCLLSVIGCMKDTMLASEPDTPVEMCMQHCQGPTKNPCFGECKQMFGENNKTQCSQVFQVK